MKRNSIAYGTTVGLLFVWAAFARFQLPAWPFADPGAWGYLHAAVSKLTTGTFHHSAGRNFLYPGFLLLILSAAKSFRAITIVQHLLGLGAGALLLLCWNKTRFYLRALPPLVHLWAGLGVAAIYLLSDLPIGFEHMLRPESITPFFALLNILLTLRLLESKKREGPSFSSSVTASLLLVNSILLVTLKTSFGLTILFSLIPVVALLFDRRNTWPRRVAIVAIGIAASLIVYLPERALAKSDPAAQRFLPESLFTIHANLILRQMEEDLAQNNCGPYPCDWLRPVSDSLREEMGKSWEWRKRYRTFRFDPDYLMYNAESLALWTDRFFEGDYEKKLSFYHFYYMRTLRRHPEWIIAKVVSQLRLFYRIGGPAFAISIPEKLDLLYQEAFASLGEREAIPYPPLREYLACTAALSQNPGAIPQPELVRRIDRLFAFLYLPVLLLVLSASVVVIFVSGLRHRYRAFVGATLLVYSYNFGNTLGTAVLHSLHLHRYISAQYSFSLLSECIGILFLLELGWRQVGKSKFDVAA